MKAVLFDARLGRERALEPQAPPRLRWAAADVGAAGSLARERGRLLAAALERALRYLGYQTQAADEAEVFFGESGAPAGALWLRPGAGPAAAASEAAARGYAQGELRLWALKRRYREEAPLSWPDLDAARADWRALVQAAAALRGRPGAPNPVGLAGYRQRFRDALARDFDAPEALASLWAALRPGALSPASQRAALAEADEALGLGLPSGS